MGQIGPFVSRQFSFFRPDPKYGHRGNIQAQYDYDAYGRQKQIGGILQADFGYTGFYQEKAAGFYLTWFRAYDPEKGRWLSRDPLSEASGINLYEYVGNSLFNGVDIYGADWTDYFDWFTPQVANTAEQVAQDTAILAGGFVGGYYLAASAAALAAGIGSLTYGVTGLSAAVAWSNIASGGSGALFCSFSLAQGVNAAVQADTGQPLYQQNALTVSLDALGVAQGGASGVLSGASGLENALGALQDPGKPGLAPHPHRPAGRP